MNDKYEIGEFGHAVFPQNIKDFNTHIDCYGTIKAIEKKFLLFEDNDGLLYLIEKRNFEFDKQEFNVNKK